MTSPKRVDLQRLIHVYTGHSKGKTTASVGLTVRARGADWKVLYCSFYKPDGSSEHEVLQELGVTFKRFSWRGNFFKKYTPEEMKEQQAAFKAFLDEIEAQWNNFDLVVMDEVVYAVTSNVMSVQDFCAFLDRKPETVELVLTGRDYPEAILQRAGYVTEMKQIKHPFDEGFLPRKGIEF
jgi:cob(I)alamin adenosyltransferase